MSEITQILNAIGAGESHAAAELLPVVYEELRKLAAAKLAHEKPGQTLDATALVHEAYVRLVGAHGASKDADASLPSAAVSDQFANRIHFFAAAAEAMRRILVENARRKRRHKHGGGRERVNIDVVEIPCSIPADNLLAIDDALAKLAAEDADKAKLINLRFFLGMTIDEAAEILGISSATAKREWRYARAWLHRELGPIEEI